LAIVQSVADAQAAQVRIEDRPGSGSIFVFQFSA
jgi:signal transduction histidine kinase